MRVVLNLALLLLMALPSEEFSLGNSRGKRLANKRIRLQKEVERRRSGVIEEFSSASSPISSLKPQNLPDQHKQVQETTQQEINRGDIRSISFLSHNATAVLLANETTVVVNPQNLHQREHLDLWLAVRSALSVTASEFSAVLNTSFFTTREQLVEIKLGKRSAFNGNAACTWGLRVEPTAFRQYAEATKHAVKETGLHVHENGLYRYGASPDGLVVDRRDGTEGLLEIKCMYGKRTKKKMKQYEYCPRRFYDQIQGQMAVCDKPWCDLMIWIPKNSKSKNYSILRIHRNETYWRDTLSPALETFCEEITTLKDAEAEA